MAHGVAEARAAGLKGRRRVVEQLAARLVREALGANVGREDAVAAAVLAAWAMVGEKAAKRVVNGRARVRAPA